MATITPPDNRLRPELARLLARLRSRIRRYVAIEGLAVLLAVLAGLFWSLLALDYGYFWLTKLELPVPLRVGLVVIAIAAIAVVALAYLLLRLFRPMRARALALVLERRFPELDDRLILAVENAEGIADLKDPSLATDPLSDRMLWRATTDVAEVVDRLDLADVFDRGPLRRAAILAVALWVPILALAVVRPGILTTWQEGFVRFAQTYHVRDTRLELTIITPPHDLRRTIPAGGTYKHPRGANLVMLLNVPTEPRPDGEPWIVPDEAYAQRRTDSGAEQTIPAIQTDDRQFRLAIENVTESMNLWITGGDYTTAEPYRIEVVDPPRVESVELANYYPAYTRLNQRDAQGRIIPDRTKLSGPIATVPAGTWMAFQAHTNKPIQNVRLFLGPHELAFGQFPQSNASDPESASAPQYRATLTIQGGDQGAGRKISLPAELAKRFIADDGRSITVPLLVFATANVGASEGRTAQVAYLPHGPENHPGVPAGRPVFAIGQQTPVRIVFEDVDRVTSLEPSRFEIRGIADKPPQIQAHLRGVSNIITRRAVIPFEGTIHDDHGLADVHFAFQVGEGSTNKESAEPSAPEDTAPEKKDDAWSTRPLANPPVDMPQDFTLQRDDTPERSFIDASVEWLDTAALNLQLGQTLRVRLVAVDGDTLNGPHIERGDEHVFTIVSPEELLATLYNQEINLRKRFEQSLAEMKAVRTDLIAQRDRPASESSTPEQTAQARKSLQSAADRAFAETQQHAGEVRSIASSFSQLVEQFVNNRVHTESQLDRIRHGILDPMAQLVEQDFPRLDRAIGELRVQIAEREDPTSGLEASISAVDRLIATMSAALEEMQDLAEFHEAIQELTKIMESEQKLLEETEEAQKRSVIEGLGDLLK